MAERFHRLRVAILAALGFGCIEDVASHDDATPDSARPGDAGGGDLAVLRDVPLTPDGAPDPDAAATGDAAEPRDAGEPPPDLGLPPDAGPPDAAVEPSPCEDPQPVLGPAGGPTGVVRCADGSMNRVEVVACDPVVLGAACPPDSMGEDTCAVDADCAARPFGKCVLQNFGPVDGCGCRYGCQVDADCPDGTMCLCAGVVTDESRCVPRRDCDTNEDCDGGECAVTWSSDGCGYETHVQCRRPEDTCRSTEACGGEEAWSFCAPWAGDHLSCVEGPICGRPLHVDALPRLAAVVPGDWAPRLHPDLRVDRAERAAWWANVGALEHASVAGFARFTLQLMALGAPARLLEESQRAAADEVEHARLAFALASAYAGRPIGPGPMALADLTLQTDRPTVVRDLVREACVGETIGAAEARTEHEAATDPVVREVWARVAEDEQRHAALGWACLQWLCDSPETRDAARAGFAEAFTSAARAPALHRAVLTGVVRPIAARLDLA